MKSLFFIFLQTASIGIIFVSRGFADNGSGGNMRLIKTSEEDPPKWMTEREIFILIQNSTGFMDVTDFNYVDARVRKSHVDAIPTTLRFNDTVQNLITKLDSAQRVQQFILHFSSYRNRYYTSDSGLEAQKWLLAQVQDALKDYVGNGSAVEFEHDGYRQNSVIARLEGADPQKSNDVIVIGAHLDSIAGWMPLFGSISRSPGADDNASGSATILETLRTIVSQGVILSRTVEFHWYAAEEVGLRGSQEIAETYAKEDVNVVGMLNLDIVGYHAPGEDRIAIYTDYGNDKLVQFVRILTDGYLQFGRLDRTCGYGCSDHASWNRRGFPAAFIAEAVDTPHMHRQSDTISAVDMNQVNEFVKLGIGFVVEMGESVS